MAFYKTTVDRVEENLTYDQLINEVLAAVDAANRSLGRYDTTAEHNVLREVLMREILATGNFEFAHHDEFNNWVKQQPEKALLYLMIMTLGCAGLINKAKACKIKNKFIA